MCHELRRLTSWIRGVALAGIALLGFVAIVGSGGGGGDLLACMDNPFAPGCGGSGGPNPPSASVDPSRATVQVGTPVTFKASVSSDTKPQSYTLQWCLRPKGAATCTAIAGATGQTYTLAGANLGDDGAEFQVTVSDAIGTAKASGTLAVSSAAGVAFADGDFAPSAWTATAVLSPSDGGLAHSESRVPTGGNPDDYRAVSYSLPPSGGTIRVFHSFTAKTYDPAAQGAVYVIDFAMDFAVVRYIGPAVEQYVRPMIEQGGRRFVPTSAARDWRALSGNWPSWGPAGWIASVSVDEFVVADGPVCGANEACPDFSAQALPIRLGFESSIRDFPTDIPSDVVLGVDNWSATVWRR